MRIFILLLVSFVLAEPYVWQSNCNSNDEEKFCHTNVGRDNVSDPCYWCNFHFTCWSACDMKHQGELCVGDHMKYGQKKCQDKFRNLGFYLASSFVVCCLICLCHGCTIYLLHRIAKEKKPEVIPFVSYNRDPDYSSTYVAPKEVPKIIALKKDEIEEVSLMNLI